MYSRREFPLAGTDDHHLSPSFPVRVPQTALHKMAAWDKPELMALVLPHLSSEQVRAGAGPNQRSALEEAVEARALRAVATLIDDGRSDVGAALELADARGDTEVSALLTAEIGG